MRKGKILYSEEMGQGPSLVLLHGLFGEGSNWRTIARRLSGDIHIVMIDLRNHGQSFHDCVHNYEVMAEDVVETLLQLGITRCDVMGHSMGGKVAMKAAEITVNDEAEVKGYRKLSIQKLISVDIVPKKYSHQDHEESLIGMIEVKKRIEKGKITTVSEADMYLKRWVKDKRTRGFLLKNYRFHSREGKDIGLKKGMNMCRCNVEAIKRCMRHILESPRIKEGVVRGPVLCIKGELSEYINDADKKIMTRVFPNFKMVEIKGGGHWVHADKTEAFIKQVVDFLGIPIKQ